jgi:regulator of protease activity HflC (stomatin/prohibitin superfamily)
MNKILILVATLFLTSACTIVSPGERGVRYNFGSMSENTLEPGVHLWVPFIMGTSTFNVQIQPIEVTTSSGTKDQQEVSTSVTVNLQIENQAVNMVY